MKRRLLPLLLALSACATTSAGTVRDAEEHIIRMRYEEGVVLLREGLQELPEDAHGERHDLVMSLALAQLCLSAQSGETEIASATHDMLETYAAEHAARGEERDLTHRFERTQIVRAQREATLAENSPRTWARARCRPFDPLPPGEQLEGLRRWNREGRVAWN